MNIEYKRLPHFHMIVHNKAFEPQKLYPAIEITSLKEVKITDVHDFLKTVVGYENTATHDWWLYFVDEGDATAFAVRFGS